jgi:branched-subunit amino acid aminotransferase/4-amino-4-deoxychorismate lyase
VVLEKSISDEQLFCADEVFLTSSIKEVLPVRSVGKHRVSSGCPGPVTRLLMEGFASKAEELSARGIQRLSEALPL